MLQTPFWNNAPNASKRDRTALNASMILGQPLPNRARMMLTTGMTNATVQARSSHAIEYPPSGV
jgi:hypothetical protein